MPSSSWNQTLVNLEKELVSIKNRAEEISNRFELLVREAESSKIELLQYSLEKQRESVARRRGIMSLNRDKKKIEASLGIAAGGFILGGLIAKDKYAAMSAGLSGLDGALEGFGETKWAVSLGKKMVIAPHDSIPSKGTWVTLESLKGAIEDLKEKASQGEQLGTLDNVIYRLKQSRRKLVYLSMPGLA